MRFIWRWQYRNHNLSCRHQSYLCHVHWHMERQSFTINPTTPLLTFPTELSWHHHVQSQLWIRSFPVDWFHQHHHDLPSREFMKIHLQECTQHHQSSDQFHQHLQPEDLFQETPPTTTIILVTHLIMAWMTIG